MCWLRPAGHTLNNGALVFKALVSLCGCSLLLNYSSILSANEEKCPLHGKALFFLLLCNQIPYSEVLSSLTARGPCRKWGRSSGQALHPWNQLDFSLPWEDPPVVSGQNSKVKWVFTSHRTRPQRPQGADKPETLGIVLLGEMNWHPLPQRFDPS